MSSWRMMSNASNSVGLKPELKTAGHLPFDKPINDCISTNQRVGDAVWMRCTHFRDFWWCFSFIYRRCGKDHPVFSCHMLTQIRKLSV